MGAILLLAVLTTAPQAKPSACASIAPSTPLVHAGEFTNMRHTVEHAYGFTVTLWRAGECLIGVFASSAGLAADTPIGLIQDVKYDPSTGRLSFAAKLTMGATTQRGSTTYEPTRDFYSFEGRLSASALTGSVTHEVRNHPTVAPTTTDVTLALVKPATAPARAATSYVQWQLEWKPILAARGPKW